MSAGRLTLVPTPVGNLEDITLRALRVLREADHVLAEDTRHTGRLLAAHGIKAPFISFHEHNEERQLPRRPVSSRKSSRWRAGSAGILTRSI